MSVHCPRCHHTMTTHCPNPCGWFTCTDKRCDVERFDSRHGRVLLRDRRVLDTPDAER